MTQDLTIKVAGTMNASTQTIGGNQGVFFPGYTVDVDGANTYIPNCHVRQSSIGAGFVLEPHTNGSMYIQTSSVAATNETYGGVAGAFLVALTTTQQVDTTYKFSLAPDGTAVNGFQCPLGNGSGFRGRSGVSGGN